MNFFDFMLFKFANECINQILAICQCPVTYNFIVIIYLIYAFGANRYAPFNCSK